MITPRKIDLGVSINGALNLIFVNIQGIPTSWIFLEQSAKPTIAAIGSFGIQEYS